MKHTIEIKRVYSDPGGIPAEGFRVFVDRLWPRGESKEKFHYDFWAKNIAPSTELREWYHTDPATRWNGFVGKYMEELDANQHTSELVSLLDGHEVITLLYSSRDEAHNNAVVLQSYLEKRLR